MGANAEAGETQTFTPSGARDVVGGRRVELFDPTSIEERVVGGRRPTSFEQHFPLEGRVGEGGMGEVYFARDAVLARDVAIKVLHKRLRADPRIVRRFLREAQITAQLEHPNVVPCHALESAGDGSPAFVMKLIEGETFKDYTRRCKEAWGTSKWAHGEFGIKARVELFLKVCDALAYSHDRGVIHRDIKPSNVMRGDFNVVYVMDWGIARLVGAEEVEEAVALTEGADELPETRTMTGDLVGTPLYMSPEQVHARSDELTPASDQYSLGLLLFNLITCEAPRAGKDVFAVIAMAGRGELIPFPTSGPGREAPRELRAIIDRATRPNPGLRYPSVAELAADLRRFLHGEEVHAYPDNLVRAAWRKVSLHPTLTLAALLGIVTFAGASTSWSLFTQLRQSELAEERTELLTGLVSDVSHHVHRLDRALSGIEQMLATMATDVERRLAWREPSDSRWFATADLLGAEAPADAQFEPRYGHRVSFEAPLRLVVAGSDARAAHDLDRKLGDLTSLLRAPFTRSLAEVRDGSRRAGDLEAAELMPLLHSGARMHYTYLGFEQGAYYCYPSIDFTAPDYDHRKRSWYRRALELSRPGWDAPYLDASGGGYLMPCVVALHSPDGELAGVAGLSIALDVWIENLEVPSVPDALTVQLVDERGLVLIDSRQWGRSGAPGLHGDKMKEPCPLGLPELEAQLAGGGPSGIVTTEAALYAWSRFQSMDWVLVIELPRSYLPD